MTTDQSRNRPKTAGTGNASWLAAATICTGYGHSVKPRWRSMACRRICGTRGRRRPKGPRTASGHREKPREHDCGVSECRRTLADQTRAVRPSIELTLSPAQAILSPVGSDRFYSSEWWVRRPLSIGHDDPFPGVRVAAEGAVRQAASRRLSGLESDCGLQPAAVERPMPTPPPDPTGRPSSTHPAPGVRVRSAHRSHFEAPTSRAGSTGSHHPRSSAEPLSDVLRKSGSSRRSTSAGADLLQMLGTPGASPIVPGSSDQAGNYRRRRRPSSRETMNPVTTPTAAARSRATRRRSPAAGSGTSS